MVITARKGLFLWLLAITCSTALTVAALHRQPPSPCADSATRVYGNDVVTCPVDARLEVVDVPPVHVGDTTFNPYMIVKCTCSRATPSAGAP